jgi:hypothetical protein
MRKYLLILISFVLIAAGSCKKDKAQRPVYESTWTLNNTKHNIAFAIWSSGGGAGQYAFQDEVGNTLRLSFPAKPTEAAAYELVSSDGPLIGLQFKLEVVGSFGAYTYKGDPITVNFTKNKDGIIILLPKMTLGSGTQTPSEAELSASIFIP